MCVWSTVFAGVQSCLRCPRCSYSIDHSRVCFFLKNAGKTDESCCWCGAGLNGPSHPPPPPGQHCVHRNQRRPTEWRRGCIVWVVAGDHHRETTIGAIRLLTCATSMWLRKARGPRARLRRGGRGRGAGSGVGTHRALSWRCGQALIARHQGAGLNGESAIGAVCEDGECPFHLTLDLYLNLAGIPEFTLVGGGGREVDVVGRRYGGGDGRLFHVAGRRWCYHHCFCVYFVQ